MSNLIAVHDGSTVNSKTVFKDAEVNLKTVVLDEDGAPVDLTGHTVQLECYATSSRTGAAVLFTYALTAPTAGHLDLNIVTASFTLAQGTYSCWVKDTDGSGEVSYSVNRLVLVVK